MKQLILTVGVLFSMSTFASCPRANVGGLCPNEKVISDKGLMGTVTGIFPATNEVMVSFNGHPGNHKWPLSRLGLVHGCASQKFCVDDEVISDKSLPGKISAIFPDGEVAIAFSGHTGYHKWPINRLSKTSGCTLDGYCKQDIVISDKGLRGLISGISKNDNQVMVSFEGHSGFHQWPTNRLAVAYGCTTNDYCLDDVVISDKGLEGKISAIFPDGEVAVAFSGHAGYHKWPTNRLAITLPCDFRPRFDSRRQN